MITLNTIVDQWHESRPWTGGKKPLTELTEAEAEEMREWMHIFRLSEFNNFATVAEYLASQVHMEQFQKLATVCAYQSFVEEMEDHLIKFALTCAYPHKSKQLKGYPRDWVCSPLTMMLRILD